VLIHNHTCVDTQPHVCSYTVQSTGAPVHPHNVGAAAASNRIPSPALNPAPLACQGGGDMVGLGEGGIAVEAQDGYEAARSSPVDDYDEVCLCLCLCLCLPLMILLLR
jgi:hypothetical protein